MWLTYQYRLDEPAIPRLSFTLFPSLIECASSMPASFMRGCLLIRNAKTSRGNGGKTAPKMGLQIYSFLQSQLVESTLHLGSEPLEQHIG